MTDWNSNVEKLLMRARTGDSTNRDELIEYMLPFVGYKTDRMISTSPYLLRKFEEDIKAEGSLALVKAIDTLLKKEHKEDGNSLGYISIAISRSLGIYIEKELKHNKVEEFVDGFFTSPNESLAETWDTLNSICQSDEERDIIQMRASGHTDAQIAEILDLPRLTIFQLRRELHDRFSRN